MTPSNIQFTLAKQQRRDFITSSVTLMHQADYSISITLNTQDDKVEIECRFMGDWDQNGLADVLEATAQAIRNGQVIAHN